MPEQQREADLEAWLRGDRPLDIQTDHAASGAAQQRQGDLRPEADPLGERLVEQGEADRDERSPHRLARQQHLRLRPQRLQEVAGSHQLDGGPVADADAERQHAVENEDPGTAVHCLEPIFEIHPSGVDLHHLRGGGRPGEPLQLGSEAVGEIGVEIEQALHRP